VVVLVGCSGAAPSSDAGSPDASVDAGSPDAGALATMSLFQTSGMLASLPVVLLEARVSIEGPRAHAYDDGRCTADHFDAAHPEPAAGDAAWLRIAGFAGGTLLDGGHAGQPVVCMPNAGVYGCAFPAGALVSGPPFATFPASSQPLGAGPVLFATGGGADFGAAAVTSTPEADLALQEDLSNVHWETQRTLHPTCADGCAGTRVDVELLAVGPSAASWGVLRCTLPYTAELTLPAAGISAMFGGDRSLDRVRATVVRLSAAEAVSRDLVGRALVGRTGRGAFGITAR
jgi:hypothetical protein